MECTAGAGKGVAWCTGAGGEAELVVGSGRCTPAEREPHGNGYRTRLDEVAELGPDSADGKEKGMIVG